MADRRKGSSMTASELLARLRGDPEYVARTAKQEQERRARALDWRKAAAPLVADLQAAGVQVESEWDLVGTTEPYAQAVPILLRHLPKNYPDRVREGIARALAARGRGVLAADRARRGWDVLATEFRKSEDPTALGAKWGIACALAVAGDDSVIEDVIGLLGEERHGENRVPLLEILARSGIEEARGLLRNLTDDPQLGRGAKELLKKKSPKK